MKAYYTLALLVSVALIGCKQAPAPVAPAVQKPACGEVMKNPEKYATDEVKRCEAAGFERTDRKGGF